MGIHVQLEPAAPWAPSPPTGASADRERRGDRENLDARVSPRSSTAASPWNAAGRSQLSLAGITSLDTISEYQSNRSPAGIPPVDTTDHIQRPLMDLFDETRMQPKTRVHAR